MERPLDPTATIRPARLAHFVLRTRNLDSAIAFYEALIGMRVVHGVRFDPEKLLERYERGDPLEALSEQGSA